MHLALHASTLTTGDQVYLIGTVYDAGAAVNLTTYTMRACIQDGRGNRMTDAVTQASGTTGATWASGIVAIAMTAAEAAGLVAGRGFLELELTTSGGIVRTLPLVPVTIQPGAMS